MKKGLIKMIFKFIFKLIIPIIVSWCLIEYWKAELIVDKIHYGIFMIAMLILMLDNTHKGGNNAVGAS